MATYLQGVTDYIPQVQPFQPDLNFYKGVLDVKESQYKEGYDRINRIYGYLMNSPLTRDVNIERRENYFNQIAGEIQRLSGVDLSLEQNVDAAYSVFKPLIDDNNVAKDMAWTNNLMSQYKRAEGFRNCTDEKLCGGKWWEGGVQALNFMREDFAKASDEEALGMGNARYTPYVNVMEKAFKAAKDMGFNVQSVRWTPDGRYIVTEKNGTQMVAPLNSFLQSTIGRDPLVTDLYNTQAYLERKNFSYGNTEKYGSEEAAERYYLSTKLAEIDAYSKQMEQSYNQMLNGVKTDKQVAEEKIKNGEVNPDLDLDFFEYYDSLQEQENVINGVIDDNNNIKGLIDRSTLLDADITTMRRRVDSAVAGFKLGSDLLTASLNYAQLNNEVDIKADPYAEAQFKHSLDMAKMEKQLEYDIKLTQYKTAMDIVKESYKTKKGGAGGRGTREGLNPFGNEGGAYHPVTNSNTEGANIAVDKLYDVLETGMNQAGAELSMSEEAFLTNYYNSIQSLIGASSSEAVKAKSRDLLTKMFGGQQRVQQAIQSGIIDENFAILDADRMSSLVKFGINVDNSLMDRTYDLLKETENLKMLNPTITNQLNGYYENYEYSKLLFDDKVKTFTEGNKAVVNTFSAKAQATLNKEIETLEKKIATYTNAETNLSKELGESYKITLLDKKRELAEQKLIYDNILDPKTGRVVNFEEFKNKVGKQFKGGLGYDASRGTTGAGIGAVIGQLAIPIPGAGAAFGASVGSIFGTSYLSDEKALKKKYNEIVNNVKKEFESGKPGYPQATHIFGGPMSGVVDFAEYDGEMFGDALSIIDQFYKYSDQSGMKVFGKDPISKATFNSKSGDDKAQKLLDLVQEASYQDWDYDDRGRPLVTTIYNPIALEDANISSYQFIVNESFLRNHPAAKVKGGSFFDGDGNFIEGSNIFTIYEDRGNLALADPRYEPTTYMQKAQEDTYLKIFNNNTPIVITGGNRKNPDAQITITNKNGIGAIEGYINTFNPSTGQFVKYNLTDLNGGPIPGLNPFTDNFDSAVQMLKDQVNRTFYENEMYRNILRNNSR